MQQVFLPMNTFPAPSRICSQVFYVHWLSFFMSLLGLDYEEYFVPSKCRRKSQNGPGLLTRQIKKKSHKILCPHFGCFPLVSRHKTLLYCETIGFVMKTPTPLNI